MFKKSVLVLAFVITVVVIATPAMAGNVRLVSETWDNICKVEVKWGMNAPQEGPGQIFTNVEKGTVVTTQADKLCYRRSGDPGNCNSQMTAWTCCTHLISGTDDCSLN